MCEMELLVNSNIISLKNFDNFSSDKQIDNVKNFKNLNIDDDKIDSVKPFLAVLTYLGGYCSYSVIKNIKCEHCKDIIDSDINLDENYNLIKNLDRGGL